MSVAVETPQVTYEAFRSEWLCEITDGNPSTIELGRRFARKLFRHWFDIEDAADDIVYCDGTGDGGIDIAYLDRDENLIDGTGEGEHTWYLVQSKYGSSFTGVTTILQEGQKIVDALDGKRENLSSVARDLMERLRNFRNASSERDRIVLVFATIEPLSDSEKRALGDVRALGRNRLGAIFDNRCQRFQV